jgi:hypothetical protein
MSPIRSRRAKLVAAAVAGCLVFSGALFFAWPRGVPGLVDVQVTSLHRASRGALCLSVVLSNRTPRTLNVVDDSTGNPAFILDERGGQRGSDDNVGTVLTDMANKLTINLASGFCLTNTVWVTNPPPRFRLRVELRDLAAERRYAPVYRLLGTRLGMMLDKWRWRMKSPDVFVPASRWIERRDYQQ